MSTITIERPVYSEDELRRTFAKDDVPKKTILDHARRKWERFSWKDQMLTWFPILVWLPQYDVKKLLPRETLAGITIAVVNIPQGMAFALLTLLPPVFGLYIAFFPLIPYVLTSSCPHQSWGGFGVTAIMSGDAVSRILDAQLLDTDISADEGPATTLYPGNTTDLMVVDQERADIIVEVSITIALLVGLIQLIMGLLRMGFVSVYLSKSFIQGLTAGAACHVVTSQVPRALGISIERFSGSFAIVLTWIEIFKNLPNINWATFIVSTVSLLLLLAMNFLNERYKDKLPVPIPMDIIVIIIITVLSFVIRINVNYDVDIVEDVPLGFPTPRLPNLGLIGTLFVDAFAIALVTYAVDISLGKTIAVKYDYQIDDNQELVASGLSNSISSFFLCYVSGPSLARIWIAERAGAMTQITGAVSCVIVLVIMLILGNLLEPLPLAVLAIQLIFSLIGMIAQVKFLPAIYRQSKWDFAVWIVTFLVVVFLGVALGLFIALGFSCVIVAVRHQLASFWEEGTIGGSEIFVDKKTFKVKDDTVKCKVFHMDRSLCFLNAVAFKKKLMALAEATSGNELMEEANGTELATVKKTNAQTADTETASQSNDDVNNNDSSDRKIIINCATFSFVDLDGARTLAAAIKECKESGVTVLLACCLGKVRDMLLGSGQFEGLSYVFYPTVIDAYNAPISDVRRDE